MWLEWPLRYSSGRVGKENPDVQRCSGKGSEFYNRLVSECDTYMDKIKYEPTPQNFNEFGQYLFETNQKKEWIK